MPNTTEISIPLKGMQTDLAQLQTSSDSYPFALNAMVEGFWAGNTNFLQNEQSNKCSVEFPPNYQVIGFREIPEQNRTIYFLHNPITGFSQIGEVLNCNIPTTTDIIEKVYCKNCPEYTGRLQTPLEQQVENCHCEYRLIIQANCLNLNLNYPLDIEYRITNCGIQIYYTDNYNERRFTYFDYTIANDATAPLMVQDRFKIQTGTLPDVCNTPIYAQQLDCEKIKVHPNYKRPCINFVDFVNGGNLKAGTYQFLIAYADVYGNPISTYFPASATIPLFLNQITFETNYVTSKAIKFNISDLKTDSLFQYYNIVVAQTIDNFTEFIGLGTFSTTQTSYVYTGFEKTLKRLTAQEVFFKRPFYKTAKSVTTANNYLFYGGVKEYPILNLQPVANQIHLQWETVALKEGAYNDARNTFYFHTYQRDEVYAFGIVFEMNNGRDTCSFHIPGRTYTDFDIQPICNDDVIIIPNCDVAPIDTCTPLTATFALGCGVIKGRPYKTLSITSAGFVSGENYDVSFDGGTTYQPMFSGITSPVTYFDVIANALPSYNIVIRRHCLTGGISYSTTYTVIINRDLCTLSSYILPPPPDTDCKPRWQVYNTGSVTGTPREYNDACELDKCWEYGEFGYWHSTERYPNVPEVWGNLCGQNIRHHKFPDSCITHIHDGKDANKVYKDNNYIFPIGVRIDHQQIKQLLDNAVTTGLITQQQRNEIVSYRITRANRVGEKSINAKGLLFNMFEYDKFGKHYYFPNYSYNDVTTDDFLDDVTLAASDRFTFHSPDVHFTNSAIGNIFKVETEEYGQSEGYFTYSDCQPSYKFLNNFTRLLAFGLGLAAAISATGEKECKVLTYKSREDVKNFPVVRTVSTLTPAIAGLSGTPPTVVFTPVNIPGIVGFDSTYWQADYTNNFNNLNTTQFDKLTGITIPANGVAGEQITTCTGQGFQVFNSNPFINGLFVGANNIIQRTILGIVEMNKVLDTLRTLIPKKNYSTQYNSVGKYNNYKCSTINNKNRLIEKSAYIEPFLQNVDEPSDNPADLFTTININNLDRESSVYLKLANTIATPTVIDNSKVAMRNSGLSFGDLNVPFNRTISSYYVSLKNEILNQYGQLCNIEYLETSPCSFYLNQDYSTCQAKVFGGDTFINRFALKRKMPFFLHTMCKLPDESDVIYSELGNAGTPKYYFDTARPLLERISSLNYLTIVSAIATDNDRNYDLDTSHLFHQEGYVPLFSYGIPYFLVESDINVDYRHGQNNTDKDFYPHNKDLKTWFEEENVPLVTNNYYFYNRTYSKQNKESTICTSCILNYHDLICQLSNNNRLIYSDPSNTENKNDNWLIFKANNYYDFRLSLGELISADGIENDKVLVRLTQGTQLLPPYNTIQATEEHIQVGTGGIFKNNPQDVAVTDLGYAGTQHRDILHTEYGHIWADAARGQIFNLSTGGQGMDELTKTDMKSWFKENLPFQIKKDFPAFVNIDNNLNGVGLHYCFDKRFNRILITKLDYKVHDKNVVNYNPLTQTFFVTINNVNKTIDLSNAKYFCNKSWTISHNFYQKSWTSFHSYRPTFYVEHIDTFDSATSTLSVINNQLTKTHKLYTHNFSNKSYQVFYGKLEPFIIEFQAKQSVANNTVNSVEYYLDVIRYHNQFDTFYNRTITFNKAVVYNERQTSGLLQFKISNPEDGTQILDYPKQTTNGYEILTTNSENVWRFNDFYDVAANQLNNVPIFNYDCNNVNKQLNTKALDYNKDEFDKNVLRQRMCRVRLINDAESRYKFVFNFGIINQKQSAR